MELKVKIHFMKNDYKAGERPSIEALEAWNNEKLIPSVSKSCTGFMMELKNKKYLTDDMDKVTCGLCIRQWNKFVKIKN